MKKPSTDFLKMNFIFWGLWAFLSLSGCSSTPEKAEEKAAPSERTEQETGIQPPAIFIDIDQLQKNLNMNKPDTHLGYSEKAFNTCKAGAGYSTTANCQQLYFVAINYRLQCRDTEGTISVALTEADTRAITGRSVTWAIKNKTGTSQTDNSGYAQIRDVFVKSPRTERVRLSTRNEILYMRANELKSVVTPRPWCD